MCTCITYENGDFYFGRNLDLEYHFGEKIVITPRNYPFHWKEMPAIDRHYAMIGMAAVEQQYPLYAEAVNEKGLGMAGLNFPGNAYYRPIQSQMKNVTPYELIPWVLGQCATVKEARELIGNLNVINIPFAAHLPLAPLHWMIADKKESIVLEAVKDGVFVYENPYGVLTNNPPFPYYQAHIANYIHLTGDFPQNQFLPKINLSPFGQGLGAVGLPGDFSPASRFVKATFLKWNSQSSKTEIDNITQFFHILDGVAMVRGAVITPEGKADMTTYSCCVNAEKGIYYYKTYDNYQIHAIALQKENLEESLLKIFELETSEQIHWQN